MDIEKYIALRHLLHSNAELSGHETKTQAILMDFIRENSDCEISPKDGWFYAVKRGGDRKLAFRADMDALPIPEGSACPYASKNAGVSHRCGHDGHSAALAAFACEAKSENTLYFIFQPAEEIGTGARECAGLLREQGIEEIYGFHNLPGFEKGKAYCRKGVFACASMGLELSFKGKRSHAAYPENGINPTYAISRVILALDNLKNDLKHMTLITVVGVTVGGESYGTSAGDGKLCLTIRGEDEEELEALKERIIALCSAESKGMEFTYEIRDPFPETRSNDSCVDKLASILDNYAPLPQPMRWSEDFGYYLKQVKGAFFGIGDGDWPALHTEGYDFPDDILLTAVETFQKIANAQR